MPSVGLQPSLTVGQSPPLDLALQSLFADPKLLGGVADKVGREINPKVFTPQEFRRRKRADDPFLSRVLAAPRIFVIGNEHELGNLG